MEIKKLNIIEKTCLHCSRVFQTTRKEAIFCSRKCSQESFITRTCRKCGKKFLGRVQAFVCRECSNVYRVVRRDGADVIYECACKKEEKVLHHFDYNLKQVCLRLCHSCHVAEHHRLRALAAQAASNTHLSDVPVSNDGASLTRTTQIGNGDNAPDTVLSDAQVEPIREAAQTASEQPSLLAEMR